MDSKEELCFETRSLGKLKILAFIGNNAFLEKMYDTPEKYIIASGFNIAEKSWNFGSYYTTLKDAFNSFSDKTKTQINTMEQIIKNENDVGSITTNDMFKKIYTELKEEISKNSKEVFVKEYYIPSINYNPDDKSILDHYFTSGIEMELDRIIKQLDNKVYYCNFKDKYYFSNDEFLALRTMNKEIRHRYEEIENNLNYDINNSEMEEI